MNSSNSFSRLQNFFISKTLVCHQELFASLKKRWVVITEKSVLNTLARPIANKVDAELLCFEGGEKLKTRSGKAAIEEALFSLGCGRDTALILVGGGALLDVAGFVAATYCRGIPYFSYPTTLLAMTDAAIGGKTAINVMGVKNFIGAFHPSSGVTVVLEALKTLSQKEFVGGLFESIKHALIADAALFTFIQEHLEKILQRQEGPLSHLIEASVAVKQKIIELDPKEKAERAVLNFGHTVGHALEGASNATLPHGEAVALGMMVEGFISYKMGFFKKRDLEQIKAIVMKLSFDFALQKKFCFERLSPFLMRDKKNALGQPRFVVLESIGKVHHVGKNYTTKVPQRRVKEGIEWVNSVLLSAAHR